MRILVTGADGFVGRASCRHFAQAGAEVVAAVRVARAGAQDVRVLGDVGPLTDWSPLLEGSDAVVHLIAVTHSRDSSHRRYHEINVAVTAALAEQARQAGVKRFVYVSSIKVNGEGMLAPGSTMRPYSGLDQPSPQDDYGQSKWQAEQALQDLAIPGVFEPVILRPPLIYGPGQKANLLNLMRWIERGFPLPFAAIDNLRSLIYVDNLARALHLAAIKPNVAATPLTLADVELSTAQLVQAMADALGVRPRLFACPSVAFRMLSRHPRGRALVIRLCGSLRVDSTAACAALGWTPAISFEQAMRETATWYRALR